MALDLLSTKGTMLVTSTVEGARAIPGQHRWMSILGASRWVALLLALVFAFSTILHVTGGGHGAFAEDRGHELIAASQGDDAACHPDASGHVKDGSCTLGVSCALCVPVERKSVVSGKGVYVRVKHG